MKIILNFNDVKELILDSFNGINNVSSEDEEGMEFVIDVDGNNFYRFKRTENPIVDRDTEVIPVSPPPITRREHKLGEPLDFETLVIEKPLVDNGVHPPKKKTLEEENEEAMKKGLMTRGRGSARPVSKL